jgi:hypothetical protein
VCPQFTALYGLFVLWNATRRELLNWQITLKFAVVKAVILIGLIQYFGLLEMAKWGVLRGTKLFPAAEWGVVLNNVILSIESPFLYLMVLHAFPASELTVDFGDEEKVVRAVPSFELAISQAIYHSKWLLGRFLGLMKGIEGQATETAA